ncbi:response regulator [Aquihabitans daechungensis]|uniref:response regulator n=1 Tax=Aquihabitans daechungensis TaxID=1052257 RepID=UPI003B9FB343
MTTTGGAPARVLVIDDEPQIGMAVKRSLEAHAMAVTVAATGEDGLALAAAAAPDLVIVDLGLPDIDGLVVIERLRSWTEIPIIVLSGSGEEATKVRALELGADDFVSKPFGVDELRARVGAVLRRTAGAAASQPTRRFGDLVVDLADRRVALDGAPLRLTKTEFSLLEAFVTNPGKLLTHWWLLDKVWGRGVGSEGRQYLRVYTGQLRSKLGDDAAAPRFILTEPGVGYRWIAPLD